MRLFLIEGHLTVRYVVSTNIDSAMSIFRQNQTESYKTNDMYTLEESKVIISAKEITPLVLIEKP